MSEQAEQTIKYLPIGLAITLAFSLISGSIWLGGLANRIDTLEKEIDYTKHNAERLIRLEEKVDAILEDIHDLKRQ
ncbi:MAG: hypothetical protein SWL02_09970 [Pseudomonadota bacterium]|nr:hypothetical protein [Pseudomonadota bacterium]